MTNQELRTLGIPLENITVTSKLASHNSPLETNISNREIKFTQTNDPNNKTTSYAILFVMYLTAMFSTSSENNEKTKKEKRVHFPCPNCF